MLNKVQLIGRLGADPELHDGPYGEFATFSVATSETWRDKKSGERREKTEWHKVVVYNEHVVGIVKQYLSKGDLVYIEGSMATRKWEKDGQDHYTTEVVIKQFDGKMTMLSSKADKADRDEDKRQFSSPKSNTAPSGRPGANRGGQAPAFTSNMDDDIPF